MLCSSAPGLTSDYVSIATEIIPGSGGFILEVQVWGPYRGRYFAIFRDGLYLGNFYADLKTGFIQLTVPFSPGNDFGNIYIEDAGDWALLEGNQIPTADALIFELETADRLTFQWQANYKLAPVYGDNQLSNITVQGAKRGVNCDVYSEIPTRARLTYTITSIDTATEGFVHTVSWWNRNQLVATGSRVGNGPLTCLPASGSGLTIPCTLNYSHDVGPSTGFLEVRWPFSYQLHWLASGDATGATGSTDETGLTEGILAYPRTPNAIKYDNGGDLFVYQTPRLKPGIHHWNILSVDDEGNVETNPIEPADSPKIISPLPASPTITSVVSNGSNQITINWDAGEPGCTYDIYASKSNRPVDLKTSILTTLANASSATFSNLLVSPNDFTNAAWYLFHASSTANTITDASNTILSYASQTFTIPDDTQAYTFSVYILKTTSATVFPAIEIDFENGSEISPGAWLNTNTGVATLFHAGSVSVVDAGSYWRISLTASNDHSGNTLALPIIIPASHQIGGILNDATLTNTITCMKAQFEPGTGTPYFYDLFSNASLDRTSDYNTLLSFVDSVVANLAFGFLSSPALFISELQFQKTILHSALLTFGNNVWLDVSAFVKSFDNQFDSLTNSANAVSSLSLSDFQNAIISGYGSLLAAIGNTVYGKPGHYALPDGSHNITITALAVSLTDLITPLQIPAEYGVIVRATKHHRQEKADREFDFTLGSDGTPISGYPPDARIDKLTITNSHTLTVQASAILDNSGASVDYFDLYVIPHTMTDTINLNSPVASVAADQTSTAMQFVKGTLTYTVPSDGEYDITVAARSNSVAIPTFIEMQTNYPINSLVVFDGVIYRCIASASNGEDPDVDVVHWVFVSNAGTRSKNHTIKTHYISSDAPNPPINMSATVQLGQPGIIG